MRLSILTPTLKSRKDYLDRLAEVLEPQLIENVVEWLTLEDEGFHSTGRKRQALLHIAKGDYICFIDDDDLIPDYYVEKILEALNENPDVVGIHLYHYEDHIQTGYTYHSLKYNSWWQEPNKEKPGTINYYRNPNHLNPVKKELALKAGFPDKYVGEDKDYSMSLLQYLKTEVYIDTPIYFYLHKNNK